MNPGTDDPIWRRDIENTTVSVSLGDRSNYSAMGAAGMKGFPSKAS